MVVNTIPLRASVEFERALREMQRRIKEKTGISLQGTQISEALARKMNEGILDDVFNFGEYRNRRKKRK